MIVICTGCQARFRVADDKIGPRGAKVRCTRCQNVFVVKRDAPEAPPSPKIDLDLTPGLARPAPVQDPFAPPPAGASVIAFPGQAPTPDEAAVDPFAAAGLETFPNVASDDPFVRATGFTPPVAPFAAAPDDPFSTTGSRSLPVTDLSQLLGGPGAAPAAAAPARPPAAAPPPPPPPPPAIGPFSPDLTLEEHSGALAGPLPAAPAPFADPADVMPAEAGFSASPGAMFDGGPLGPGEEESLALATEKTPGPPTLSPPRPPPVSAAADEDQDVEAWAAQFPGGAGPVPAAASPAPAAPAVAEEPLPPPPALAARPAHPEEPPPHRVRNAALSAMALVAVLVLALAIRVVLRGDVPLGPAALRPSTLLRSLGRAPVVGAFELADVRSGVYPQAAGGAVVFVRGVVVSRAPAPVPGVRIEAELVRDGQVLSRGAVVAGAVPSPEEVYRATDRAGRDALAAGLRERAPRKVAPGDRLGFLVTLGDAPAELAGATVRLQALPEGGADH